MLASRRMLALAPRVLFTCRAGISLNPGVGVQVERHIGSRPDREEGRADRCFDPCLWCFAEASGGLENLNFEWFPLPTPEPPTGAGAFPTPPVFWDAVHAVDHVHCVQIFVARRSQAGAFLPRASSDCSTPLSLAVPWASE